MGRGVTWTAAECADVARAWIFASEDPILGTDQTSNQFYTRLFERFCEYAPTDANEKQYKSRGTKATRHKWEAIAADCQKFRSAIRAVRLFQPTGVNKEQKLSMAISIHVGKRQAPSYDAKDYPHSQWNNHLAWQVLCKVPKFMESFEREEYYPSQHSYHSQVNRFVQSEEETPTDTNENMGEDGSQPKEGSPGTQNTPNPRSSLEVTADAQNNLNKTSQLVEKKRESNRGDQPGRKKAKLEQEKLRQNTLALKNGAQIAKAMTMRADLLAEHNALLAFSLQECETEEDRKDRQEYMRLTRKDHLERIRKRHGCSSSNNEITTGGNGNGDNVQPVSPMNNFIERHHSTPSVTTNREAIAPPNNQLQRPSTPSPEAIESS